MAEKSSEMTQVLARLDELRAAIDNLTRLVSRPASPPRAAPAATPTSGAAGARQRMPVRAAVARRGDLFGQRNQGLPAGFRGVTLRR